MLVFTWRRWWFQKIQPAVFGTLLYSRVRMKRSLRAWCFGSDVRIATPPGFLTPIAMLSPLVPLCPLAQTATQDFLIFFLLLVKNEAITSPLPLYDKLLHCAHTWSQEMLFSSLTTNCYQLILVRVSWFMLPWIIKYSITNMCKVLPKRHLCLLD